MIWVQNPRKAKKFFYLTSGSNVVPIKTENGHELRCQQIPDLSTPSFGERFPAQEPASVTTGKALERDEGEFGTGRSAGGLGKPSPAAQILSARFCTSSAITPAVRRRACAVGPASAKWPSGAGGVVPTYNYLMQDSMICGFPLESCVQSLSGILSARK
jgi:hypothetical protein